jgi:hypothetical protein
MLRWLVLATSVCGAVIDPARSEAPSNPTDHEIVIDDNRRFDLPEQHQRALTLVRLAICKAWKARSDKTIAVQRIDSVDHTTHFVIHVAPTVNDGARITVQLDSLVCLKSFSPAEIPMCNKVSEERQFDDLTIVDAPTGERAGDGAVDCSLLERTGFELKLWNLSDGKASVW